MTKNLKNGFLSQEQKKNLLPTKVHNDEFNKHLSNVNNNYQPLNKVQRDNGKL